MKTLQVSFSHRPRQPFKGWFILAAGIASLAASAFHLQSIRTERLAIQQSNDRQIELAKVAQAKLASLKIDTGPDYLADKRWKKASSDMTLPWVSTLKALDRATKPPVFLNTFKSDPASGKLLLEAEATVFSDVLDYVKALNATETFTHSNLLSHDTAANAQGANVIKFSVQTQWSRP